MHRRASGGGADKAFAGLRLRPAQDQRVRRRKTKLNLADCNTRRTDVFVFVRVLKDSHVRSMSSPLLWFPGSLYFGVNCWFKVKLRHSRTFLVSENKKLVLLFFLELNLLISSSDDLTCCKKKNTFNKSVFRVEGSSIQWRHFTMAQAV